MIRKTVIVVFATLALGVCAEEPDAQDRYEAALGDLAETRRDHMQDELSDLYAVMAREIRGKGHECDRVIRQDEGAVIVCQTSRGEVNYRLRANGDIVTDR